MNIDTLTPETQLALFKQIRDKAQGGQSAMQIIQELNEAIDRLERMVKHAR